MTYNSRDNGTRSYDYATKALHDKLWNGFRPELSWAVACTMPRAEMRVAAELVRLGYQVWLPMTQGFKTDRLNKRKRVAYEQPLFPTYLFVHLPGKSVFWAGQIGGFSRFIMDNGAPYLLSGNKLAHLHTAENAGLFDHRRDVARLAKGDNVQLILGPLAGFKGQLQNADGAKRCEVLLNLLGTETTVHVDVANVRAVG